MGDAHVNNEEIAGVLDEIAHLLDAQDANPFRVRAYRRGTAAVRKADVSVAERLLRDGEDALVKMEDIGEGLASTVGEYVRTGRSSLLDRLQGEVSPETLFTRVPGIGEELADRVVHELDVHTLEELEQAAHDGRLARVVIYYERNGREGQSTVVTETRGPLQGKRVVRGREKASREYYAS